MSVLTANHIRDWVKFYRSAPEGYKPKALEAVLTNDGPKALALVLKELKLERSIDLVADWNDASTTPSPLKDSRNVSDKDSHTDDGGEEQG